MNRMAWGTLVTVFTSSPLFLQSSYAGQCTELTQPARLNWWSNQTDGSCIYQGVQTSPESVRLNNCTSGFVEGTVSLPFADHWTLSFLVLADGDAPDPDDFVDVFINGDFVERYFNDPPGALHRVDVELAGNAFDYRFEFTSDNAVNHRHMSVHAGTAAYGTPLWWTSHSDASSCVGIGPVRNDPERVRLQNCTFGFSEGTVPLPDSGPWALRFFVRRDEDPSADLDDFVDIFINDEHLGTYYNNPPSVFAVISHTVTGPAFDYRFELTSFNNNDDFHMSVEMGSAAPPGDAPCPADLNADCTVNAADLALLLGAWGPNPGSAADLNGDDTVNAADLALQLGGWGPCP